MDDEVIGFLSGRASSSGAARVSSYLVYLDDRQVTVNVMDHGEGTGALRFAVEAYWADLSLDDRMGGAPGYSMGNPDASLKEALSEVHCNEFRN